MPHPWEGKVRKCLTNARGGMIALGVDGAIISIKIKNRLRILISKGFVIQKQVKINAGKIERRFGVVMTPFSSSKMIQINCQE